MSGAMQHMADVDIGGKQFSLTAGFSGSTTGFNSFIPVGSLSPATYGGQTINAIEDNTGAGNHFIVLINGSLTSGFFTSITINGTTFFTSSATFTIPGPYSSWQWSGLASLINTHSYTPIIAP